jgi:hypothetical protein
MIIQISIRLCLLILTVYLIVATVANQPAPVKDNQVPLCKVQGKGMMPCNETDILYEI